MDTLSNAIIERRPETISSEIDDGVILVSLLLTGYTFVTEKISPKA